MTLFEVDEAANRIREEVDPDANIIFGSTFDENARRAGCGSRSSPPASTRRPSPGRVRRSAWSAAAMSRRRCAITAAAAYTQPILTHNAAATADPGRIARAEAWHADAGNNALTQAAETAALRSGAFIAPRPVDAGAARSIPLSQPAVPPAPAAPEPAPKPKGRMPSLIERVTGVGRARTVPPPAERPAHQPPGPAGKPAQPRLAALEPDDRPGSSSEEELLDIPAFLRRQAN